VLFGSGSLVEPVIDPEITEICDTFLRGIGYVGICEIEVKRDKRDGAVRLIEANPRYSVTADSAYYAGVDIGWLHYLDLIGKNPTAVEANHFGFRHVVLWRDLPVLRHYVAQHIHSWRDIINSYRGPLNFFDFDLNDLNPTMMKIWALIQYRVRRAFGSSKRSI
jgi:predicted ATP-grasp superfamily ATP-dependent carboligase